MNQEQPQGQQPGQPQGPPPPGWQPGQPQGFPGVPGGLNDPNQSPDKKKSYLSIILVVIVVLIGAVAASARFNKTANTSTSPTPAAASRANGTTSTESSTSKSPAADSPNNTFVYCNISVEQFQAAGLPPMVKKDEPPDDDTKMPKSCFYSFDPDKNPNTIDSKNYTYSYLMPVALETYKNNGRKLDPKDIFKGKPLQQTSINNKTVYFVSDTPDVVAGATCTILTETAYITYSPDDSTCSASIRLVKAMGAK